MKEHIKEISEISGIFFPFDQVRNIFQVGNGPSAYPEFPFAKVHAVSENANLLSYMETERLGGIDVLYIDGTADAQKILSSLGKKLRTVRFMYVPLKPGMRSMLRKDFRFFGYSAKGDKYCYAIFVNKDVAPRYLGILRKRLKRALHSLFS